MPRPDDPRPKLPSTGMPLATAQSTEMPPANPTLPSEVHTFRVAQVEMPLARFSIEEWRGVLRDIEVRDKRQQIKLRPWFALGVFLLLGAQNIGIWFILVWALHSGQLGQLQLIFSTLIAGTLAQSYLILRLITKKVFGDIRYEHNGEQDDDKRSKLPLPPLR